MFKGSYIRVILDIAEADPRCKLSFVKGDIESARAELALILEDQNQSQPSSSIMEIALQAIRQERAHQTAKWGEQNHDNYQWLAILMEEVGELAQAILHDEFGGAHAGTTQTELTQVAAVAVQWLECMERLKQGSPSVDGPELESLVSPV